MSSELADRRFTACHKMIIVNFGGEGEVADALNINSLFQPMRGEAFVRKLKNLVIADMRHVPIRSGVADEVVGRNLPYEDSDGWAGRVSREAYRILKQNGIVRFHSRGAVGASWMPWLQRAGFAEVENVRGVFIGVKQ